MVYLTPCYADSETHDHTVTWFKDFSAFVEEWTRKRRESRPETNPDSLKVRILLDAGCLYRGRVQLYAVRFDVQSADLGYKGRYVFELVARLAEQINIHCGT